MDRRQGSDTGGRFGDYSLLKWSRQRGWSKRSLKILEESGPNVPTYKIINCAIEVQCAKDKACRTVRHYRACWAIGNCVIYCGQENHCFNKDLSRILLNMFVILWTTHRYCTHRCKTPVGLSCTCSELAGVGYSRWYEMSYILWLCALCEGVHTLYRDSSKNKTDCDKYIGKGGNEDKNVSCIGVRLRDRVYSHYEYRYRDS